MASADLTVDRSDHSAIITVNGPDKLNALSAGLRSLLRDALDAAAAIAHKLRDNRCYFDIQTID
jgi:enoyl-CoA hydratase/carnithine racemase